MIAEITQDIKTLKSLINTTNLVRRLEICDRLSVNCYFLAELVADAYEQSTMAEFLYKSSLNSLVADSTEGVGRSEAKAKKQYSDLNKTWVNADQLYKKYNLLLQSSYSILEQFRSSNSHLKNEYNNSYRQV